MAEPRAIDKKLLPYKSMDYDALRKEGIALIEKYSGHLWTDFNKHDPGITILEVLCYVITELGYKASFPLEDILYSSPDRTGFTLAENAFYSASEIFPCQPVTIKDFRELLIDRIEPVNNAWVFSGSDEQAGDLFEVWLLLDDDIMITEEAVIEEAFQIMAQHRNLCEDVGNINILSREACRLEATIFIETKIDPEKTAARILFELEKTLLNPTLKRYSVSEMLENGISPETIFDGPEMYHGYFSKDSLYDFPKQMDLLKVMNTILNIEGVYHISDLAVTFRGKKYTDHIPLDNCLPVFLPKFSTSDGHELAFYKNDTRLLFKEEESVQIYEQLKSQQKRNYTIDTTVDTAINYEEGRFRAISNYLSIQHEFPHIYGIGDYGLPPDSSEERRAQAKQLKGFLLHFEQLLANSFAQLANLKKLFSVYPVTQTYFHQSLTDVPGLTPLITNNGNAEDNISAKETELAHYQKWKGTLENETTFLKRRNDFLNHLLARFNVAFNEAIYYDFGYFPEKNDVLKKLIKAKEYYLQHIVSLLRNRGKGMNYRLEKQKDPLSLKKQLELLLDIENNNDKKLSSAIEDIVFDLMFMIDEEDDELDDDIDHIFSKEAILEDFLSTGIEKEKYDVESSPVNDAHRILLQLENEAVTIEMGTVENMNDALEEIERLCRKILKLSMETEGFYVVEHLMLRFREDDASEEEDHFYDHRMSMVFPSWPARFQKKGFKQQAQSIISEIVPAHIRADCFWIDLENMMVFEDTYTLWIKAFREDPFSEQTLEYAAVLKTLLENYPDNSI